jgi:hypothetical protein
MTSNACNVHSTKYHIIFHAFDCRVLFVCRFYVDIYFLDFTRILQQLLLLNKSMPTTVALEDDFKALLEHLNSTYVHASTQKCVSSTVEAFVCLDMYHEERVIPSSFSSFLSCIFAAAF